MNDLIERIRELALRIDRRLLPPVLEPGAMPWFSLVYALFPWLPLVIADFPRTDWILTTLAELTFLPMYFAFYWVRGWRRVGLLLATGALGSVLVHSNLFGNTFVIYACVMGAFLPLSQMLGVMAFSFALYLGAGWMLGLPLSIFLATGVLTGVLAGGCQRVWIARARSNQALRLTQDEVRRLAQVAERERIGRDLHDLLGHSLSVIALKAELATRIFSRDPQGAEREIAEVERIAREALGQVRRAVGGMRAMGLRAEFANARLALAAVEVDFEYRAEDLRLHPETETVLALALREAATNVIRHAEAHRCAAQFKREGDRVLLNIRDDGLGGASAAGNGLKGMRERIEALGGTLSVDSASGQGTRLEISVPFRTPPEPEAQADPSVIRPRLVAVR